MCVVCVQRPGHIYRSLMLHRVIYIRCDKVERRYLREKTKFHVSY